MYPNVLGNYETARIPVAWGSGNTVSSTTYATIVSSDVFQKTDGTTRVFGCTAKRLIEVTSSGITDRSAGGADYTTTTMWHGAQYGDVTIYASYENNPQSSSSGAFADLAGTPPKARFICTQSLAVALAYYNDGTNIFKDGVWISDIGDQTTWTPSSSNQAANFRLLQTPGEITGMVAFKGDILCFKANSFYRLSYVGRPIIWQSQLISDNVGATSMGLICVCDEVVVFAGESGWYAFDGSSLNQIAPNRTIARLNGATLIAGQGATFAPGGPRVGSFTTGTTFYWGAQGLALFCPNYLDGTQPPIVAVQVKAGDGQWAFGGFGAILSGAPNVTGANCIVRGTAAALVAAGIGASNIAESYPALWVTAQSSVTQTPYTLKGDWSVTSGNGAFVQTSFLGDPNRKTAWNRILPLLCYYDGTGTFASVGMFTAQKPSLADASMATAQYSGTLDNEGVWQTFPSPVSRFGCFQLVTEAATEIEDIIIDSAPAGKQ